MNSILGQVEAIAAPLVDVYKDLHANPELSNAEHRTAGIVAARLETLGLEVVTGIGGTGVAGILRNGDGPTVLLRADMDGLPVLEQTGLDYASTARATDPEGIDVPVMHACGHDVHVSCLLGASELLAANLGAWSGTLVAVFQPAEEAGNGAQNMVNDGLYSKVPQPDVVLGQHVAPFVAGVLGLHAGVAFAGADSLRVNLFGRGGHGSRPETTIDPVLMAAATVVRLQGIVSREVAGTETAVLTVGQIHSGTKNNIIPGDAQLGISLRTFDAAVRTRILDSIERIASAEAKASGATREPEIVMEESFPQLVNDTEASARVFSAFQREFGEQRVTDPGAVTGSEDVGILATAADVPLVYWILGGADAETYLTAAANGTLDQDIPANHSPHFAPVIRPTLDAGIAALAVAALEWFGVAE